MCLLDFASRKQEQNSREEAVLSQYHFPVSRLRTREQFCEFCFWIRIIRYLLYLSNLKSMSRNTVTREMGFYVLKVLSAVTENPMSKQWRRLRMIKSIPCPEFEPWNESSEINQLWRRLETARMPSNVCLRICPELQEIASSKSAQAGKLFSLQAPQGRYRLKQITFVANSLILHTIVSQIQLTIFLKTLTSPQCNR